MWSQFERPTYDSSIPIIFLLVYGELMIVRTECKVDRNSLRLWNEEDGNSNLEYATMLSLIGVTLLPLVQDVGEKVNGISRGISDNLASNTTDSSASVGAVSPSTSPTDMPSISLPGMQGSVPEAPVMEERTAPPGPQQISPSPPESETPTPGYPARKP